jgi:XTP/dITP diphosphohydrolase
MSKTIVLASNNAGKLREFNRLFSEAGIQVRPQKEFDVHDADETGLSFVENAIIKARHAATITGLPSISDDSGIEVDALNGAPGIYSARFSAPNATDERNNDLLLEKLKDVPREKRSARYQCVLAYMRHQHDPSPLIVQASWEGIILETRQGEGGFGYDPLFWVPTHNCSSAQLEPAEKNRISHRGRALQKLIEQFPKSIDN